MLQLRATCTSLELCLQGSSIQRQHFDYRDKDSKNWEWHPVGQITEVDTPGLGFPRILANWSLTVPDDFVKDTRDYASYIMNHRMEWVTCDVLVHCEDAFLKIEAVREEKYSTGN